MEGGEESARTARRCQAVVERVDQHGRASLLVNDSTKNSTFSTSATRAATQPRAARPNARDRTFRGRRSASLRQARDDPRVPRSDDASPGRRADTWDNLAVSYATRTGG